MVKFPFLNPLQLSSPSILQFDSGPFYTLVQISSDVKDLEYKNLMITFYLTLPVALTLSVIINTELLTTRSSIISLLSGRSPADFPIT